MKQNVINSFEGTLIEQQVSVSKVQAFRDSTVAFLKPIFEEYKMISNSNELAGDINKRYITGQSQIIDKSAFADNQDTTHLNFNSFLPEGFSNRYREAISEIFVLASSTSYLLNAEDILSAIHRLGGEPDEYIIISFGVNINEMIRAREDESFAKFKILTFEYRNYQFVGDSLFILKKSDLPGLNYKEFKEEKIEQYSLHKTIEEFNLYTTVVDMNLGTEIRKSVEKNFPDKDLRKSVYMGIFLNLEVQWKKNMECIQIKQASPYLEKGIINKLSDVRPVI